MFTKIPASTDSTPSPVQQRKEAIKWLEERAEAIANKMIAAGLTNEVWSGDDILLELDMDEDECTKYYWVRCKLPCTEHRVIMFSNFEKTGYSRSERFGFSDLSLKNLQIISEQLYRLEDSVDEEVSDGYSRLYRK